MASATETAELQLLNYLLTTQSVTRPTNWYIGLHTGDPGELGTANELTIGSNAYARTAVTFNAADNPSTGICFVDNSAAVTFPTASGGAWGTISHISVWTDQTSTSSADVIIKGALTASKTVSDGDTFQIQAGNLVITLD